MYVPKIMKVGSEQSYCNSKQVYFFGPPYSSNKATDDDNYVSK